VLKVFSATAIVGLLSACMMAWAFGFSSQYVRPAPPMSPDAPAKLGRAVSPYVIGKDARFAALLKRMGFESNDQQKGYGS